MSDRYAHLRYVEASVHQAWPCEAKALGKGKKGRALFLLFSNKCTSIGDLPWRSDRSTYYLRIIGIT
jgi:hypothetical protein